MVGRLATYSSKVILDCCNSWGLLYMPVMYRLIAISYGGISIEGNTHASTMFNIYPDFSFYQESSYFIVLANLPLKRL